MNPRLLFLLIVFTSIGICWFAITHYKKAYEVLPAKLPAKIELPEFQGWQQFSPPSKAFSVLLPVLPQHATANQEGRNYEMYISQLENGTIFMVSLIRFKNPFEDKYTEMLLHTIMEDLQHSNPENKLESNQMKTFAEHKALEFTIVNKEIAMKGMTFVSGQTLYVLSYISKLSNPNKKEYDYFLQSFHLNQEVKK